MKTGERRSTTDRREYLVIHELPRAWRTDGQGSSTTGG